MIIPVEIKSDGMMKYSLISSATKASVAASVVSNGTRVILPWVRALDEVSLSMPADVAFNRGESEGLAGYTATNSAVLSNEVRIATSCAWWNPDYEYKLPVTLNNLSGQVLAASR